MRESIAVDIDEVRLGRRRRGGGVRRWNRIEGRTGGGALWEGRMPSRQPLLRSPLMWFEEVWVNFSSILIFEGTASMLSSIYVSAAASRRVT